MDENGVQEFSPQKEFFQMLKIQLLYLDKLHKIPTKYKRAVK